MKTFLSASIILGNTHRSTLFILKIKFRSLANYVIFQANHGTLEN